MFQVGLGDLQDGGAERHLAQPERHLMAQDAHALRDGAVIGPGLALAGDDQDQTAAGGLGSSG